MTNKHVRRLTTAMTVLAPMLGAYGLYKMGQSAMPRQQPTQYGPKQSTHLRDAMIKVQAMRREK